MPTHKIKPGECVSSLAARTWLPVDKIWRDPGNADLREAGRDPNTLVPGDEVSLPQPAPRTFTVGTDDAHCFRARRPRAMLRLRLQRNGRPLAGEPYVLTAGEQMLEGAADDAGRLETAIPADVTRATLLLPERGERYELLVGHLEPAICWRGAAQRLQSLGLCAAGSASSDEGLRRALRHFQALRRLEVTGALDDSTVAALQAAHGC